MASTPARARPAHLQRDRRIARAIERWFRAGARDLPWRQVGPDGRRDAYRSLVSEFMLQQTQVSRVVPAFDRFIRRFPSVRSLARAPLDEVRLHWEGLGYYRRAALLHAAAAAIVDRHGARVPESAAELREIPGIGPYTAGAVASLVFGHPEPIVDANVRRVIMRIDGRAVMNTGADGARWVWSRAAALVGQAGDPGAFNEGLMELGGLVCTPRSPRCAQCPVAQECRARARGIQEQIPAATTKAARTSVVHQVVVIRDGAQRVLIEQRPRSGMWAGLWQFPTREGPPPGLARAGLRDWAGVDALVPVGRFDRATTHRAVRFEVWSAAEGGGGSDFAQHGRVWKSARSLGRIAFSVPHRRILDRVIRGVESGDWAGIRGDRLARRRVV